MAAGQLWELESTLNTLGPPLVSVVMDQRFAIPSSLDVYYVDSTSGRFCVLLHDFTRNVKDAAMGYATLFQNLMLSQTQNLSRKNE